MSVFEGLFKDSTYFLVAYLVEQRLSIFCIVLGVNDFFILMIYLMCQCTLKIRLLILQYITLVNAAITKSKTLRIVHFKLSFAHVCSNDRVPDNLETNLTYLIL